jgi:pimeloyl-ACP methyl ester carboxylesterase
MEHIKKAAVPALLLVALVIGVGGLSHTATAATPPFPLIIVPMTLGTYPTDGELELDPIANTYSNFIETFEANGYNEGTTLFVFEYDWRESVTDSADDLESFVADTLLQTGAEKVDLIAHGQGGIIAWLYTNNPGYTGQVENLLFLGSPLRGAAGAYPSSQGGVFRLHASGWGKGLGQALLDAYAQDAGVSTYDYVSSNVPSFAQMLPIDDYLFNTGTSYPNGYPTNTLLENLWDAFNFPVTSFKTIAGLDDTANTPTGYDVTPSSQPPLWPFGEPGEPYLFIGDGVTFYDNLEIWVDIDQSFDANHTKLPSDAAAYMFEQLTGEAAGVVVDEEHPVERLLFVAFLGSGDIDLTGPNNTPVSNFYSGAGTSPEYYVVTDPQVGEYLVSTSGNGKVLATCIDANGSNLKEVEVAGADVVPLTFEESCVWVEEQRIDPVVIIPGILGSWFKNDKWVIDPVLHTYDNLISTFLANGYVNEETLFAFPYDWRSSNITTAFLLKNKIAEVKEICECGKVDLIGHSMGGLVASAYIQRDDYANDVDQLFLVASPLKGAPYAYKTWEGGEFGYDEWYLERIARIFFGNEARRHGFGVSVLGITVLGNIFDYIHGWPILSIQELLPVDTDYLQNSEGVMRYPNGYPINAFLETLGNSFSFIENNVRLETLLADNGADATLSGLVVEPSTHASKWQHGEPVNQIFGAGDGTVPRWSIEGVTPVSREFSGTNHRQIVTESASYIFARLTGHEPENIIKKNPSLVESSLFLTLHSPVDMQIIAPDGKRLGKNFETGEEFNEISDAFYSGFGGDNEYAIILNPLPGDYEINTVGTGGGSYTVVADYSDLTATHSTEVVKEAVEGQEDTHQLVFNSENGVFGFPDNPEEEEVVIVEEPSVEEEVSTGGGGGSRSSGRVLGTSISRFTPEQVEAILNLLRAFYVQEPMVEHVGLILRGAV